VKNRRLVVLPKLGVFVKNPLLRKNALPIALVQRSVWRQIPLDDAKMAIADNNQLALEAAAQSYCRYPSLKFRHLKGTKLVPCHRNLTSGLVITKHDMH